MFMSVSVSVSVSMSMSFPCLPSHNHSRPHVSALYHAGSSEYIVYQHNQKPTYHGYARGRVHGHDIGRRRRNFCCHQYDCAHECVNSYRCVCSRILPLCCSCALHSSHVCARVRSHEHARIVFDPRIPTLCTHNKIEKYIAAQQTQLKAYESCH